MIACVSDPGQVRMLFKPPGKRSRIRRPAPRGSRNENLVRSARKEG